MVARRRRALVFLLTLAAVVIALVQGRSGETTDRRPLPAATVSPTPSPTPALASSSPAPSAAASAVPSLSPLPSPSPKGPPFVLDAAASCAGSTALIDLQVAASAQRPIVRLELLLDGAPAQLTPAPTYPMRSYAGRSSGKAAEGGSGTWVLRATDADGMTEAQPFPYSCR